MKKTKLMKMQRKISLAIMIFSVAFMLGMSLVPLTSNAEDVTENEYVSAVIPSGYINRGTIDYVANGITWTGTAWVKTGQTGGYITNLQISSITSENALKKITVPVSMFGYKVIEIGDGSGNILFGGLGAKVNSIVIPDSIVSIDDKAFYGWRALSEIKFVATDNSTLEGTPNNLKYVGAYSFGDCDALTNVTYYGDVTYGEYTFTSCENLESVYIENSSNNRVSVVSHAFYNCLNLEKLTYSDDITYFYMGDSCFENCALKNLNFDVSVATGKSSFANNGSLETVVFNNYASLGESAFSDCFYENNEVEKSVTFNATQVYNSYYSNVDIGVECFSKCTGLKNVYFSDKINFMYVRGYAFENTGIEKLEFNGGSTYFSKNALTYAYNLKEVEFNASDYVRFVDCLVEMPWSNSNVESISIKSRSVDMSGYGPFWGFTKLKKVVFEDTVEYISGNVEYAFGSFSEIYLKNPKVRVTLNDKTSHSYTIYGYNYEGDKDSYYYKKTGMYGWKECSDNKDNITCKNIQTKLTVSYDVDGALIDGVTFVEGQSLNLDYITVQQRYADGTVHDNTEDANGAVKIAYHENDPYLGYVLKYGNNEDKDNKKLKAGKNVVEVYYGDLDADVIITAEAKKVEDFSLTYVGEPKIEGQTISKEDFKVTNVTYNDKEVVDEVFDFEVTGTDAKLEKGKTTIQVSYDGVTKEYELEVAEKKITSLEITQRESSVTKYVGDTVAADDFLVTAIYDNGDRVENYLGFSIKNPELIEEYTELEFIAGDIHTPYNYRAIPVVATNIQVSVNEEATAVEHGEIDKSMLIVTAGLNNGKKIEIPAEDYEFEAYDIVADKVNTITVKYKELSTTFNIKGVPAGICGLQVISVQNVTADTPEKTYYIGDTVTKDDLYVTAVYNNGRKLENYQDYTIVQGTLEGNMNTIVVALNSDPSIKAECEFKAADIELEKIEVSYSGGDIPEGSKVNTDDIVVKAYYNNGNVKEIAAENYTIKDYAIVQGVKTTLTVVYNGKEASFEVKGTAAPTAVPTAEPTAVPTAEPTAVPTAEPTAVPTAEPTAEPTAVPTATPTAKAVVKSTQVATPTPEGKLSYKSSNSKIKLQSQSAKTTYKVYSKKAIKINVSMTNNEKVYYQIVKQGKKLGSKWTLAKNTITIKKNMKACVYIKYTQNGKTVIKKTSGFVFDKTAPKVSVTKKGKLKVTDSVSGIKKITVDGKKVRNGTKLSVGKHKVVAYDKAGNKKTVKVTVGEK